MDQNILRTLLQPAETKLVLLVMDGLGGLPLEPSGPTALEAASTPHLDALAAEGNCGLHVPIRTGITPGSGPAHLALFGYDPLRYHIGRGVLSALGIDFDLQPGDVAARGNFCTVDGDGVVRDRRAGRISTATNQALCKRLNQIKLDGVHVMVRTIKEHRFLLVLRGDGLSGEVTDTDPQEIGRTPLAPQPRAPEAATTARYVEQFVTAAADKLADQKPANMVLLRGFAQRPDWPQFEERFGVKAAAIARYPMYRGVAKLVGMHALPALTADQSELDVLAAHWDQYDFFFLHTKPSDSAGEDGDFSRKVQAIETVDALIPRLLDLGPDVLVVTGDHSTPAKMAAHSWHPVPILLWSETCRPDSLTQLDQMHFAERICITGGLGPRFPAVDVMPLMLAHGERLKKFGA